MPKGLPTLRTLYTDACFELNIHLDGSKSMSERLVSSFRLLKLLLPGLVGATPADIAAVVNGRYEPPDVIYAWWAQQASSFPDELKKAVCFLPFQDDPSVV